MEFFSQIELFGSNSFDELISIVTNLQEYCPMFFSRRGDNRLGEDDDETSQWQGDREKQKSSQWMDVIG
jgi:hypothetical protein